MANKPKSSLPANTEVVAMNGVYNIAQRPLLDKMELMKKEIEIKVQQAIKAGGLKRAKLDRDFGMFIDAVVLYKMKETKAYKDEGFNWENFCNLAGYPVRTADDIIAKICPIIEAFSANFADFIGLKFNEIKLLGKAKVANIATFEEGKVIYKGVEIPITSEDFNIVLKSIQEDVSALTKEKEADRKAFERVQKDLNEQLHKAHKDYDTLSKKKSLLAQEMDIPEEEFVFIKRMETMRTLFDRFYGENLNPERIKFETEPTPRMKAAYLTTIDYIRKQLLAAYEAAVELHGDAIITPETAWHPGMKV